MPEDSNIYDHCYESFKFQYILFTTDNALSYRLSSLVSVTVSTLFPLHPLLVQADLQTKHIEGGKNSYIASVFSCYTYYGTRMECADF
jgi:hypothetical protein